MGKRLLVAAVLFACALGVAVDAHAAVTASVVRGKLTVTGGNAGERIALRAASHRRLVVDVGDNGSANFVFSRGAFRRIVVDGRGGNDRLRVDESHGAFTKAERTTFNGGAGNDRLTGGRYAEILNGGGGNDVVEGKAAADKAPLGAGSDSFTWNSGDGADRVDGSSGLDVVTVSRGTDSDSTTVSPGGVPGHVKVGGGPDLLGVETLNVNSLAGADSTSIANVPGTGLTTVNVDLGAADTSADSVEVSGSAAVDVMQAAAVASTVQVTGLAAQVNVTGSEAANDRVTLSGLGAGDTISGVVGLAALTRFTADGGDGIDTLNGGNGADLLLGGDGSDTVDGNGGNDTAFLGAGVDIFVWDPGDGSDVVEGQADADTLRFNGSAGAEIFAASANGGRLLFTRNVGNIVMDTDDVEALALNALGGADTATVNSLAETDVTAVNIDLGVAGAGDLAADAVTVNGTVGADAVTVSGSAGSVTLTVPEITLTLANTEPASGPANDTLTVNTSGGADAVNASALMNSSVLLTLNGGDAGDILVGSQGHDTINGGDGDDVISAGNGNDTIDGGAGSDTIDGGAGFDTAANGEFVVNVP